MAGKSRRLNLALTSEFVGLGLVDSKKFATAGLSRIVEPVSPLMHGDAAIEIEWVADDLSPRGTKAGGGLGETWGLRFPRTISKIITHLTMRNVSLAPGHASGNRTNLQIANLRH